MKIYIGPYKNWFGPYQLAQKLCFWAKPQVDKYGLKEKPEWVHNFGTFLAHGFDKSDNPKNTWLNNFFIWVDSKKKRKVKVKVHNYDVWNANDTLAIIILPVLKMIKEDKQGSQMVEDVDVPDNIKSTSAKPKENEWDTDEFLHDRWSWVLDEMIWSFEQLQPDVDWESKFYSGDFGEMVFEDDEVYKDCKKVSFVGSTFEVDREGLKKHSDRIDNGLRLFGKYFRGLWT